MRAGIGLDGMEIALLVVHPFPPLRRRGTDLRNRQLEVIGDFVARLESPVILAGDLNTSPWSAANSGLTARTGLKSASLGHGVVPTWPTSPAVLRIPIDHILIPREMEALEVRRGADIGSDHFPIGARLVRAPAPPRS